MNATNLNYQTNNAMSIVQFRTDQMNTFDYISLSESLQKKLAEVNEVSESGSVNNLKFINHSDKFIFMSDGDILSGAKQNRVLNSSVLVLPNSAITIPVSCVEQGRWRYKQKGFSDSEYSAPPNLRSLKAKIIKENLKRGKIHMADQSRIWDRVSEYERNSIMKSDTSNLFDVFEHEKTNISEFIRSFNAEKKVNGLAIFIYNRLLNLEIFNSEKVFSEYFSKLLKSAAMEAVNLNETENILTEAEAFYKTNVFMDSITDLRYDYHEGVGAGEEKRFETDEMTGFELSYKNTPVHFVALNLKNDEKKIIGGRNGRKIFNFGKYKGRMIYEVYRNDKEYIMWLCFESKIEPDIRREIFEEVNKW